MTTCSIADCSGTLYRKGFCGAHYGRWYRYGDPAVVRLQRHGKSKTKTHKTWDSMVQRCTNPRHIYFRYYGGRGITICPRWRESFLAFLEDMGERPTPTSSIDRIDPNWGYEPGNCRWIEKRDQGATRRNVAHVTIESATHTIPEWAALSGTPSWTIRTRLARGESTHQAVFGVLRTKGWRRAKE